MIESLAAENWKFVDLSDSLLPLDRVDVCDELQTIIDTGCLAAAFFGIFFAN
jgi:hypothetical protein